MENRKRKKEKIVKNKCLCRLFPFLPLLIPFPISLPSTVIVFWSLQVTLGDALWGALSVLLLSWVVRPYLFGRPSFQINPQNLSVQHLNSFD
jgi:hypothetical protein